MLTTTRSFSRRASSTRLRWPAWSAPIVGTSPIELPPARHRREASSIAPGLSITTSPSEAGTGKGVGGFSAPMRPISGFSACAARLRIDLMRSLRCSALHADLGHLDHRISRRGFPRPASRPVPDLVLFLRRGPRSVGRVLVLGGGELAGADVL